MKYSQQWQARAIISAKEASPWFPAQVPGNVQEDYGRMMGWGDINVGDNVEAYRKTEGYTWEYRTCLHFEEEKGKRYFLVLKGVDYRYDVLLDGQLLLSHEGMFSPVEAEVGGKRGAELIVRIHPHPKRPDAPEEGHSQADQSVKPPVCYGWDWHPRMLVSGIWQDAYVESRDRGYIRRCEAFYTLSEDFSQADIRFEVECSEAVALTLFDPEGREVGHGTHISLKNPRLWWCSGQGEQALYRYVARTGSDEAEGTIGLKKIRLVMNEGAWREPSGFPKSRSVAPIQIELNGRRVFAKGSNWVNPDIFNGRIDEKRYETLITLARDAHMNIFRCWGGSGVNKQAFYDLCDRMGIMVWVEFPLACNNYIGTEHYLKVLEQEASAIIRSLRGHVSIVLWCGGNELFNSWSGMTDQSLALRLLNKLCYELDRERPFIMTSPIFGMAHGGYTFYDDQAACDVFQLFQRSRHTAYTEFGVPGMADFSVIRHIIPEKELFPIGREGAWKLHHAFNAWGKERWLCLDVLERYAPEALGSLEGMIEASQWLQCEGYKAIFEEARRQAPYCSLAVNWCYCEPWMTAANNSLLSYPAQPKPAYYAVQSALRPILASARIPRFDWKAGERFSAEIWLLNDSTEDARETVAVSIEIGGTEYPLLQWDSGPVAARENRLGPTVNWTLPQASVSRFTLRLRAGNGRSSEYTLCFRPAAQRTASRQMNV